MHAWKLGTCTAVGTDAGYAVQPEPDSYCCDPIAHSRRDESGAWTGRGDG